MADKCIRYISALSNWLSVICKNLNFLSQHHLLTERIGLSGGDLGTDISSLPDYSSEAFGLQEVSDSAQVHEQLHFYDSTDLHLGLGPGEFLNLADSSFLDRYSDTNML